MEITIGGILYFLLLIGIAIVLKNKEQKRYLVLFTFLIRSDVFFGVGYIAKFHGKEIEFNIVSSLILFLMSIIRLQKIKISNKKPIIYFLRLTICLLLGILPSALFGKRYQGLGFQDSWDLLFAEHGSLPFIGFNAKQFIGMWGRFFIFFFNMLVFSSSFHRSDLRIINKTIHVFLFTSLVLFLVEFLSYTFLGDFSYRQLILTLFGHSSATYEIPRQTFGGFYYPLLLLKEPSAIATLFSVLAVNEVSIYCRKRNGTALLWVFILIILLVCSKAMSSLLFIPRIILSLLSACFINKKKIILLSCVIGLMLVASAFIIYQNRLAQFLAFFKEFSNGISGLPVSSTIVRSYSIYISLQNFLSSPLFGIGLGISYSHSGLFTRLSNIGVIGFVIFILLLASFFKSLRLQKTSFAAPIIGIRIAYSFTGHRSRIFYMPYTAVSFLLMSVSNRCEAEKECTDLALFLTECDLDNRFCEVQA